MRITAMRFTGFLLLVAGWGIDLAALAMLKSGSPQNSFVLAGTAVEMLGLTLAARSYIIPRGDKR
jgi:hypothetical protein